VPTLVFVPDPDVISRDQLDKAYDQLDTEGDALRLGVETSEEVNGTNTSCMPLRVFLNLFLL